MEVYITLAKQIKIDLRTNRIFLDIYLPSYSQMTKKIPNMLFRIYLYQLLISQNNKNLRLLLKIQRYMYMNLQSLNLQFSVQLCHFKSFQLKNSFMIHIFLNIMDRMTMNIKNHYKYLNMSKYQMNIEDILLYFYNNIKLVSFIH